MSRYPKPGIEAVAGGVEMMVFPDRNVFVKTEWLDLLPVSNHRLPGVVLGVGLGIGSLITAFGLSRRTRRPLLGRSKRTTTMHWSWFANGAVGAGLAE